MRSSKEIADPHFMEKLRYFKLKILQYALKVNTVDSALTNLF